MIAFFGMSFWTYGLAGLIALLYASVGHGGASGYIALLSLTGGYSPSQITTTALILNVLVSANALFFFQRARHVRVALTWPFVVSSIPMAYYGASFSQASWVYSMALGLILALAALMFLLDLKPAQADLNTITRPNPWIASLVGALLGLVSGWLGVGGGIFLSPLMVGMRWGSMVEISATSASFIFLNSLAGLWGRWSHHPPAWSSHLLPLVLVSLVGSSLGAYMGANRWSSGTLKKLLGLVLLLAAFKLWLQVIQSWQINPQ